MGIHLIYLGSMGPDGYNVPDPIGQMAPNGSQAHWAQLGPEPMGNQRETYMEKIHQTQRTPDNYVFRYYMAFKKSSMGCVDMHV